MKFSDEFVCICSLFNIAVSSSGYVISNDRVINEQRIRKDIEGSGRGLILGTISVFAWRRNRNYEKP
jgi:hypothetical protein